MKTKLSLLILLAAAVFITSCGATDADSDTVQAAGESTEAEIQEDAVVLRAVLLSLPEGSAAMLVASADDSGGFNLSDLYYVAVTHMDASAEPTVGDILEISYDGMIMETWPAQLGEIYRISVAEYVETATDTAIVTSVGDTDLTVEYGGSEYTFSLDLLISCWYLEDSLPETGDLVEIIYSGEALETVYSIQVMDVSTQADVSTAVTQPGPCGSISVTLPLGWTCELCGVDDESLMAGDYGIHFYPEGAEEGYVELAYVSGFGVCGIGLVEETVTLAGDTANVGYYDGSDIWDFVAFDGKNLKIVALTYDVESWWDEYGGGAWDILDTLVYDAEDTSGTVGLYGGDSGVEDVAVCLTVKDITPTQATLVFTQYDSSVSGELTFGEHYSIEKKDGDTWVDVEVIAEGSYAFNDVACFIPKGAQTEHTYTWDWLYGELAPGEYRIKTYIHAKKTAEDATDETYNGLPYSMYDIYAYFILK